MRLLTYISISICFILLSCKTQNLVADSEKYNSRALVDSIFAYDSTYQYRIKSGDKLSISIWGQDDLSIGSIYGIYNSNEVYGKWLLVDANGNVEIPKIGTTMLKGKTCIEAKIQLTEIFRKWILNPVIEVRVLNKEVSVLGEIRTPGNYIVDKDQVNLLEIISRSGGYDFYANLKQIKILRQEGLDTRVISLNLTKAENFATRNILLHPGDIVIVPSKKYKTFDKRISTIIPFTTAVSAAALIMKIF